MTNAQVVETWVTVNNNSPIQDYVHPEDQTQPFEMTPGFKPFTKKKQKHIGHIKPSIISTQVTTQTATKETAAASTSKTPMSFLDGAVVSGGQFTISINVLQTTSLSTIQTRSYVTETTESR